MSRDALRAVAEEFRRDSRNLFRSSPFYRGIAERIADDGTLLKLAGRARSGQSPVLMLLAGVHYLVLRGVSHPLARVYRELARGRAPDGDPFPTFHDFCLDHEEKLRSIISSRRVQTNEIGRSVYVRLGMDWLAAQRDLGPLSVVELGASAGLNLAWDTYRIRFVSSDSPGDGAYEHWTGDPGSSVRLECEVRGGTVPRVDTSRAPRVVERLGLDLHPPDLRSPDDVHWLCAFIWPDQPVRMNRLRAAVALVLDRSWPVVRADASEVLVEACASLHTNTTIGLFHTVFLHQLASEQRHNLESQVEELARSRDLVRIALEERDDGTLFLAVSTFSGGRKCSQRVLGLCHSHGDFIDCRG